MLLYAIAIVAFQDLAALEATAGAVAGTPVTIDRRLRLAQCAEPPAIARTGGGLSVGCAAPPWRIFVASQRLAPIIHRGDPVTVAAKGPGFDVTLDGTAETDATPGTRLRVRSASGGHLTAFVEPDGSLTAGYTLP